MKVLITGTAGFIGFHLARRLIDRGDEVIGLDAINNYYDINLKYARLSLCGFEQSAIEYGIPINSLKHSSYKFIQIKLEDRAALTKLFERESFDVVCNLAAQAGVRYSLSNPEAYIESNIVGFSNVLECCRHGGVKHLVYASSSSVYGLNTSMPFSVSDSVDHPISLYAASKKSNELMAHAYSHLFSLPTTGLRFFTVYGPWGRPDMALFIFVKSILEGHPIDVYNNGDMMRDFTYIDDIVEGIVRVMDRPPVADPSWSADSPDPARSIAPYRLYNIGNSLPVSLLDFIDAIEVSIGKKAIKNLLPLQPGDVQKTWADVSDLERDTGYKPRTSIIFGVEAFVEWYRSYFKC